MNVPDEIKRFLVKQPEAVFDVKTLMHNSQEIDEIVEHLQLAANPSPGYSDMIRLLRATQQFRLHTEVEGMFARMRHENTTDDELRKSVKEIIGALSAANALLYDADYSDTDKLLLKSAYTYCVKSITDRVNALQDYDRLLPIVRDSKLNEYLRK